MLLCSWWRILNSYLSYGSFLYHQLGLYCHRSLYLAIIRVFTGNIMGFSTIFWVFNIILASTIIWVFIIIWVYFTIIWLQRRQSGSKSGGSWIRSQKFFDSMSKNSDLPEKFQIFQAKILTTFFLVVNFSTCILSSFSLFLIKKDAF